jgi:Ca2+-binding EF-hand superfamily protein
MKVSGQGWNTQNVAARHEELFAKLDRDGDKKITKDEMKTAMSERSSGAGRAGGAPSLDEIFSRIDTNGDGGIDQEENEAFATSMASRRPQGPPNPAKIAQRVFEKGDADGDGKLTKAELTSALPKHDASDALDALFEDADGDGDGAITQAEFQASLEKRLEYAPKYDKSGGITVSSRESRSLGVA